MLGEQIWICELAFLKVTISTILQFWSLKKIASNAGQNGAVILERVKEADFETGYNAATNKLVDMFDVGIIDPAKVTRSTLQNAASIASMILTTECIIVDKSEENTL